MLLLQENLDRIGGVMVSVLASVVADVGSISSRVKSKSIKLVFTRNIIVCV